MMERRAGQPGPAAGREGPSRPPGEGPAGRPEARPRLGRGGHWWEPLGLTLLVAAAYGGTLSFDLLSEDRQIYEGVPAHQRLGWQGVFASPTSAYLGFAERMYRPLLAVSAGLDRTLWGARTGGFHLTSLLAHLAAVLLLWRLAWWLTGSRGAAFAAAALLAVHPSAAEAVAFVSARMDVLVGLGLAATLLLLRGCLRPGGGFRLMGALACFALTLCAKETAVAVPAIILWVALVHPGWFTGPSMRPGWWPLAIPVVPFWLLLGLYLVLRSAVIGGVLPTPIRPTALPMQAVRALVATGIYGRITVVPALPTVNFRVVPPEGALDARALLGLCVAGLLLAGLLWLPRRHPEAAVALGWYAAALVPVSNVLPIYGEPYVHVAERSLYPALGGWCLLVALGVKRLMDGGGLRMMGSARSRAVGIGAVLGTLLLATFVKAAAWRNDVALLTATVDAVPDSPVARALLGRALAEQHDLRGAEAAAQEAAALFPDAPIVASLLAWLAELREDDAEALRQYERAMALGSQEERVLRQAALLAARQQDWGRASRWFRAGADQFPLAAWPHVGLGCWQERLGRADLARKHFERAARLEPRNAARLSFLGHLRAADGRLQEAVDAHRSALALDPSFVPAQFSLATTLERAGRMAEAASQWRLMASALPEGRQRDAALAGLRRLESAAPGALPAGAR